jgi:hypothetical protein
MATDFNWKKLIGTVAPSLGLALGGPLGGVAAKAIVDVLGLPAEANEEAISEAVRKATPAELLALKQADLNFAKDMKALDIDLERILMEDRDSARKREIATGDHTNRNIAYAYTTGYFALLLGILYFGIRPEIESLINVLVGILSAAQASIMGYYFGSSKGSTEKTLLLGAQKGLAK